MWWVPRAPPSRARKNFRMFEILPPERVTLSASFALNQAGPRPAWA